MAWFAAHAILYFKFKDKKQNRFPLWENIYLIWAETDAAAWRKATRLGRQFSGKPSDKTIFDGRPAVLTFAGIRKIISCSPKSRIIDGTEATYSVMEVSNRQELNKLLKGTPVSVKYRE